MNRKISLFVGASLASAAMASGAWAQDEANTIEQIVVTAEKREEKLIEVPVAISAFTDERRQALGIRSVQDLTDFTPGLAYASNTDFIYLRGIGRFTNNRATEGGVAIYSDGVYTSTVASFERSNLFIERTEVLRGPQGTLYGKNAIGGALNIVSKRPTDAFYAEGRATFQNYDGQTYEAAVSGPLFSTVRGRIAGAFISQDEGYFTNVTDGRTEGGRGDQWHLEGQLDGSLGDGKFEWWARAATTEFDTLGRGPGGRTTAVLGVRETGQLFLGESPGLIPNASIGYTTDLPTSGGDLRLFEANTPNAIDLEDVEFQLHATLHLDGFDVRYIVGHHFYDYVLQQEIDPTGRSAPIQITSATPFFRTPANPNGVPTGLVLPPGGLAFFPTQLAVYHEKNTWFSNELNFVSTTDAPLQWLGGLFQYREKSNYTGTDVRMPDQPQFSTPVSLIGTAAAPNPLRQYAFGSAEIVNESYAAFGQVDWRFAPAWTLTAGVRYTYDRKRALESARVFCWLSPSPACTARATLLPVDVTALATGAGVQVDPAVTDAFTTFNAAGQRVLLPPDPATGLRYRQLDEDWGAWSGTFGAQWQPDAMTSVYAKYSRGYKAGGFNAGQATLPTLVSTRKETVDGVEVGLKKVIGDTLQVNASAFYYDYKDLQAPLVSINPVTGSSVSEFFNVPKAVSKGFELETIWQPIDNLRILANYAYLDAEIKEGCCFLDSVDPFAIQPGATPAAGSPAFNPAAPRPRGQDLKGQALPYSTPHRVAVNAAYTWNLGPGDLTASASWVWRDKTYYSIFNRWYNEAKAYEIVDAQLLYNDRDDRFTVIGFVKNLFESDGLIGASAFRQNTAMLPTTGFINRNLTLIAPRTYGVELQYRFR